MWLPSFALQVPKIGGAEIDLHRLYCEVTKYGGVEQVIARKMFVTVCEPFNFPASFTNKSFVMRKLYNNMLHHYEQVRRRQDSQHAEQARAAAAYPSATQPAAQRSALQPASVASEHAQMRHWLAALSAGYLIA